MAGLCAAVGCSVVVVIVVVVVVVRREGGEVRLGAVMVNQSIESG